MICRHICECKRLAVKINLLKPREVAEVSGFMTETKGVCTQQAKEYWAMRTIQINWGTSSEVLTIHREALDDVLQHVTEDVPF